MNELHETTAKRLDAAKTKLRAKNLHILQRGGSTRFVIKNECRDEAARLLRANGFDINCRNGEYEVSK